MSIKASSRQSSWSIGWLLSFWSLCLLADQVQMQNGDRYNGRLIALTNETLIVQSDVLGVIALPRSKVATISLGTVTNRARATLSPQTAVASSNAPGKLTELNSAASLRQLQSDTNSIRKIQQQFLAEAGPEANKKFNEMAQSLMTGQMSMTDLRAQAASAAEQLRALKREVGNDIGGSLDGYLEILESFLKEVPASK